MTAILFMALLPSLLYLSGVTLAAVWIKADRAVEPTKHSSERVKSLCIIIPAHNEEAELKETIDHIKAATPNKGGHEIFVIVDNCSDRTQQIAEENGCQTLVRSDSTLRGKSYALQFAFEKLSKLPFDAYVVLDADIRCQKNLLTEIEHHIHACDGIQIANVIKPEEGNSYSNLTGLGFIAMNVLRPLGRSSLGLSCGLFGTGFVLSKELVLQCPYDTHSLVEDYHYHLNLVIRGYKIKFVGTTHIYSSVPNYNQGADTQRTRWEAGKLSLVTMYVPKLAMKVIRGEFRLFEPLLDLLVPPLSMVLLLILISTVFGLFFSGPAFALAGVGLLVLTLHVICAARVAIYPVALVDIVSELPRYILWKARLSLTTLKSASTKTDWKRTSRAQRKK